MNLNSKHLAMLVDILRKIDTRE